ncbi:YqaA family protein [Dongia rigui]|uniref:YqaA family protein n=1 Tax=Dongia rigui TaxID=940149 RepID=A0ABU5DWY2_9PROT|nr:YqaA family protein [Dongia rigui]MDY0871810.1 YqaA family protein [Dongia rigui]
MTHLAYLTLFLTAFGAATILPGFSEVAFATLLLQSPQDWPVLMIVATAGNTLGGIANWVLGRFLLHWQDRTWFPVSAKHLAQASRLFQKYGYPLLLLSWLPIIGDPITLAAGVLRARFLPSLILILIGKAARYGVLAWATLAAAA